MAKVIDYIVPTGMGHPTPPGNAYSSLEAWADDVYNDTDNYHWAECWAGKCGEQLILTAWLYAFSATEYVRIYVPLEHRHNLCGIPAYADYGAYIEMQPSYPGGYVMPVSGNHITVADFCQNSASNPSYLQIDGLAFKLADTITMRDPSGSNAGIAIQNQNCTGIVVANCMFAPVTPAGGGQLKWAIDMISIAGDGSAPAYMINNVAHNTWSQTYRMRTFNGTLNGYLYGNVSHNGVVGFFVRQDSGTTLNVTAKNNIAVGHSVYDFQWHSGTLTRDYNLSTDNTASVGASTYYTGYAVSDIIGSAAAGRFKHNGNAAYGGGVALTLPDLGYGTAYDATGADRGYQGAWDLGAWERRPVTSIIVPSGGNHPFTEQNPAPSPNYSSLAAFETAMATETIADPWQVCTVYGGDAGYVNFYQWTGTSSSYWDPVVIRAHPDYRHDGTAAGVALADRASVSTAPLGGAAAAIQVSGVGSVRFEIEGLTIFVNSGTTGNAAGVYLVGSLGSMLLANCLIADLDGVKDFWSAIYKNTDCKMSDGLQIVNCIATDCDHQVFYLAQHNDWTVEDDLTLLFNTCVGGTHGIYVDESADGTVNLTMHSNICVGASTACYYTDIVTGSETRSYNLSSDATATGSNAITGASAASVLVDASSDWRLTKTSPAIDTGVAVSLPIVHDGEVFSDLPLYYDAVLFERLPTGEYWDRGALEWVPLTGAVGIGSRMIGSPLLENKLLTRRS